MESLIHESISDGTAGLSAPGRSAAGWQVSSDGVPEPSDERLWRPVLDGLRVGAAGQTCPSRIVRATEIVLAMMALALLSPLLAVIAVVVRLDSPGPCLFWQPRVGRGGRLFHFVKFRTLYSDARARWPDLYAYRYSADEIASLHFKLRNDPRVTRVGQWLRRSTLDELPNLWNVIVGDVALVGPRPEIPEMLPYYAPIELAKFSVRPGITGLAQVRGRGDLSFRETVRLDLEYVRTRNLWLDLGILGRTVVCTVLRRGAF
jgi:lipopolysaccharide/colanic/teichoic acid biosynthesis glycosyltransferase